MDKKSFDPDLVPEDCRVETMARLYWVFLIMRSESWRAAEPAWITPTQAAILNVVLASRRPMCISDIARELHCSRPTISRSVANLEDKCYVVRTPCRWDARKTLVKVGHPGRTAASWAREWDVRLRRAVDILNHHDLDALSSSLNGMLKITRRFDRQSRSR